MEFRFHVLAAYRLRVNPNGTEVLRGKAAGAYRYSDTIGDFLWVKCIVAGTWEMTLESGTWTDE